VIFVMIREKEGTSSTIELAGDDCGFINTGIIRSGDLSEIN
jgi:hypothetical protein